MELSIETAIPLPVGKRASGIVGIQKNARLASGGECLLKWTIFTSRELEQAAPDTMD